MDKICFKCKRTKPKAEFYRHPMMGDGFLGKCKDCTRSDAEENRQKKMKDPIWVEKERLRQLEKGKRRAFEFPELMAARRATKSISKPAGKEVWHHWSYLRDHRKDVVALTNKEHLRAHRYMVYDRERMQYRRADTMELLDTRERHEAFLSTLSNRSF